MEEALSRLPRASKGAVVCPRSVGQCILTTPAIRLMKQRRPDILWAAVAEADCRFVFEDNPGIATILSPHLPPLWSWRPRICVDFQGSVRSLVLTELSGAEVTAGLPEAAGAWAYSTVAPDSGGAHWAECCAGLAFHLGAPRQEVPAAALAAPEAAEERRSALIYPFAAARERTWPAESFLDTARELQRRGFEVVFTAGRKDDLSPFSAYRLAPAAAAREWIPVLLKAAVFIGNHTDLTQIAAALQVPQVVVCPPGGCGRMAPWKAPAEILTGGDSINSVDPAQVVAAVERLGVKP